MKCDICDSVQDVVVAPRVMTDQKMLICKACYVTWYDSGETTAEGIRRERLGVACERR